MVVFWYTDTMFNSNLHLHENLINHKKLEVTPTRDGFGRGLVEAGKLDINVVALTADLAESTRVEWFKNEFPDRFIEVGVAEQNLVTIASGMASIGKIPFATSYATFSPGRNWEQIRTTIAINNQPVKIVGCHAGLTVGPDGATHQALEDIAIMRVLSNMTVVVPCDSNQAYLATLTLASYNHPAYLRLGRSSVPTITSTDTEFVIGKSQMIFEHPHAQVTIIACGSMVYTALQSAQTLAEQGIYVDVINMHTIKPVDSQAIINAVKKTGAIVTAEEHQIAGGLGSSVSEVVSAQCSAPIEFVGVRDTFGQSGTPEQLMQHYGLTQQSIIDAVERVITRKV